MMLVRRHSGNSFSDFFSSFDVLDKKNHNTCEKKYSYDSNEGDDIPDQDSGLCFYGSNNRCFSAEGERRIGDIEFHGEII